MSGLASPREEFFFQQVVVLISGTMEFDRVPVS
jgi:hypothetical protein